MTNYCSRPLRDRDRKSVLGLIKLCDHVFMVSINPSVHFLYRFSYWGLQGGCSQSGLTCRVTQPSTLTSTPTVERGTQAMGRTCIRRSTGRNQFEPWNFFMWDDTANHCTTWLKKTVDTNVQTWAVKWEWKPAAFTEGRLSVRIRAGDPLVLSHQHTHLAHAVPVESNKIQMDKKKQKNTWLINEERASLKYFEGEPHFHW